MAPHLQSQFQNDDLLKVGTEGFAMVDDICGRQRNWISPPPTPTPQHLHHGYQYYQQQSYLYRGPQVVIDSNQAAQLYGGTVIVDYSKRKPAGRAF
ncbi:hypothetical protein ACOSP7_007264 [Xanthoceras sorbifolium]